MQEEALSFSAGRDRASSIGGGGRPGLYPG